MKAIAAMDLNRVIGYEGKIPWYISEDYQHFRKMTSDPSNGGYLVMGNTAYQKIGPLPKRFTYVLTTDEYRLSLPATKCQTYVHPNNFHNLTIPWDKLWVCGGAKTYKLLLPQCKEVYLTIVLDEYDGDIYMPEFEDQFTNQEIVRETKEYWIVRYWK